VASAAAEPARPRARRPRVDVESVVGYTLMAGVLASLLLIATGLAWHGIVRGTLQFDYMLPGTSVADFLRTDVEQTVLAPARPRLLVNWGIAVLLLTPYVRVLASMVYFALGDRDWKYTLFTAFVLGTLTYGIFGWHS
jgi:uncharacterized membrane protein